MVLQIIMASTCQMLQDAGGDTECQNLKELSKGKGSLLAERAVDDLRDLCAFNENVSVCLGKSMQHMTDSLFITMSNFTFMHRDAYLDHLETGLKQDNCALRNAPLQWYIPG